MVFLDFLFALVIAAGLAAILTPFYKRGGVQRAGVLPIFGFLFVVLFFATWAGAVWLIPFGPAFWGVTVLPFVTVALLLSLILAAVIPIAREQEAPTEHPKKPREGEKIMLALGLVFWLVVFLFVGAIVLAYLV